MQLTNISNNNNNICAGYGIDLYNFNTNNCTKEMKWKISLNNNKKYLYMCDHCKNRGTFALDNRIDYIDNNN